jgi:uncharacterized membrane protein YfcA
LTLLLAFIVWLAVVVEATAGFGATVVTVTLASHLLPIEDILAAFVPVNFVLSAYLVARYRGLVDRTLLFRRILPLMGLGVIGGLVLFQLRDAGWIKVAFGAFVVALSAIELARARRGAADEARPLARPVAALAMVGAGVIHGLFACGGPMLVYVIGREIRDKGVFRATLAAAWVGLHVVLLSSYVAAGTLGASSLRTSAALLVSFVAGLPAGEWVHRRLEPERFRVAVFGLLLVAGGALLVRAALGV